MIRILVLATFLSVNLFAQEKKLSLDDLGFKKSDIKKVDKKTMKKIETRKWMLKTHQWIAFSALAAMTGAMATGGHGKASDDHVALGVAGAALYYTAAAMSLAKWPKSPPIRRFNDHG